MNKLKKGAVTASIAGILALAGYEGFRGEAYQPLSGDSWTIGFGHTSGVQPGDHVDLKQAVGLLAVDLRDTERAINRCTTVPLKQHEFDALVSFVYNIGPTAYCSSTLLKCLNAGDRACVAQQWMRWKYFKGTPVAGLEKRRASELAWFRGESLTAMDKTTACFTGGGCISLCDLGMGRQARPDRAEQIGESRS